MAKQKYLNVRISARLHGAIKEYAESKGVKMSPLILSALAQCVPALREEILIYMNKMELPK